MIRGVYTLLLAVVLLLSTSVGSAQNKKVNDELLNSASGAQGTEFIVAFPCNDNSPFERNTQFEIYIATSADVANVRVRAGDDPAEKRFQVLKNRITTMSLEAGGPLQLQPSLEIRALESEVVTQKGVVITSDKPISVYVLSAKTFSSDGYLAIPTSAWGRRYMPVCYFDFKESNTRDTWAGGFVVIAKDDDTDVTILLRGEGGGIGRTRNGKRIGERFTINMRRGETYQIMGDGTTRGDFDLTGSLITSTKPIGLISFHSRTMVPNQGNFNGRDPLYEMIPPVSAWGKKYVSVEYNRNGSNNMGKGDYYRILAAEDGTVVTGRYLHKINKSVLGTLSFPGTLRSGEFRDFAKTSSPVELPNGVVIIEANKPIFVMQYNCSAAFDGDQINDPFMINVTPMEQYISGTIFQTPDVANFTEHYFTMIVEVLHPETEDADLKSLAIDGIFVYQDPRASIAPQLLTPQSIIPPQYVEGRRVRHCSVVFGERGGTHIVTSNGRVRFGGYIFGNGNVDSYGWPAAAAFRDVSTVDTLPPLFTKSEECGDFTYNSTEIRNQPDPPVVPPTRDSMQVETGFFSIRLDTTDNYRLVLLTDPTGNFPRDPSYKRYDFRVEVINKGRDAFAIVAMQDFADNITYDTVSYFADRLTVGPLEANFGRMRLGTSARQTFTITNRSGANITLRELRFKGTASGKFTVVNGDIPPVVNLADGAVHRIEVEYQANEETTDPRTDWDVDTLIARTVCSEFEMPMRGMAVMPRITVVDWDAGTRAVNEEICLAAGLRITNPGTDTLVISNITGVAGSFRLSDPTDPALPIRIPPAVFAPQNVVFLKTACFQRTSVGSEEIDVTFETNDAEGDNVSEWKGRTQAPGPFIKGHDFGSLRENSLRRFAVAGAPTATSDCIVYNTGTEAIRLTGIRFVEGAGAYWPAGSGEANYIFKIGAITLNGAPIGAGVDMTSTAGTPNEIVTFEVFFRPNVGIPAAISTAPVEPVFSTAGVPAVSDNLLGEGLLPTADVNAVTMTCLQTPEGIGVVNNLVIPNTTGTMPLSISNIQLNGGAMWEFVTPPTYPIVVQPTTTENIPIRFTRPIGDQRFHNLDITVTHDGIRGNGTDEAVVTTTSATRWSVGSCDSPIPEVTNLGFAPQRTSCDTPEGQFVINVTGGGRPVEIRALEPLGPDNDQFQIIEILNAANTPVTVPFLAAPGESYRVRIRYVPTTDGNHEMRVQVRNFGQGDNVELIENLVSTITGSSRKFPVTFNLVNDVPANASRNPGTEVTFTVNVRAADFPNLEISSAEFVVDVADDALSFSPGSLTTVVQGWTVTGPVERPSATAGRREWVFTASGTPILGADADVFRFRAILMLAAEFASQQNLTVNLPRPCQIPSATGSATAIFNCALTQRVVAVGRANYALPPVVPNPAIGGSVSVDFGVGINAHTTLDLIDLSGNSVRTFINSSMTAGEYTLQFPTAGLPNGAYMLRMQSGAFNATQRLIIAD
jgi:hypothetical protein